MEIVEKMLMKQLISAVLKCATELKRANDREEYANDELADLLEEVDGEGIM